MHRRPWLMIHAAAAVLAVFSSPAPAQQEKLRLNQIQILGTHNSYRTRPPAKLWEWLQKLPALPAGDVKDLDYGHPPLPEQFAAGIRSVELDIYSDPQGGRFLKRAGLAVIGEPAAAAGAEAEELQRPGCKILHHPDFDFASRCLSLRTALAQLKTWSDANRNHVPVIVHLETKDETLRDKVPLPNLTEAAPWDAAACDALDAEIREAFAGAPERIFTPDRLRGSHATLEAAARTGAWPLLSAMRGRVLFVMEGVAPHNYVAGHPSLAGRVCFIYGRPGRAETAFLLMNDAARQREEIMRRVREGYMVRTRADSGTTAARTGDTKRRDAALAGGAHIVSTDYPQPDPRGGKAPGWTTYSVQLPGGSAVRANPVTAPQGASVRE
jgi:hypothetical protein